MILVDTSIWIDYLRSGNDALAALLQGERVCIHPWIIGELACGNLSNRIELLGLLGAMPHLTPANEEEALRFIELRQLMGRGIGYIDVHLLAASVIHGASIWTRDKRLNAVATELGVVFQLNDH